MRVWLLQRNEPTPHDGSGSQRIFRTGIMARMLVEAGHEVVWWTSGFDHYNRHHRYHNNHREPVQSGYDVQYLKSRGYKKNVSLARILTNNEVARSFTEVAYKDADIPDVIIASIPTAELAWQGIKYAKVHKVPVILDVRDLWPDHIIALAPSWARYLVKVLMRPLSKLTAKTFGQATGVFGLTDPFVDWGLDYAGRGRNGYDRVVPMGYIKSGNVDKDRLAQSHQFWDGLGITEQSDHLIALFIGTIGRGFNLNIIMEAARKLKARNKLVKLVICGDGELAGPLREQAAKLDNVLMPGWIDEAQIKSLLLRGDVGLLPYINSENFTKNLPNKPAEYLSEGLLLASSLSVGPLCSLIDEFDCGFSYSGSVECLAEKLSFYSDHPEQLQRKKENSLEAFNQKLDGVVVYSEMIEFLENVVTKSDVSS